MNEIKILIVYDIDILSASKLSEKFVCLTDNNNNKNNNNSNYNKYDLCLVCGPFIHENIEINEEESIALGNIASIIAQFENIVCRVIYLSSNKDPLPSITNQLCLTPNSVNINSRSLPLIDGLYISGFTETENVLTVYSSGEDSDDETQGYEVQTSTSAKIINEVLTNAPNYAFPNLSTSQLSGIFMLNYKYVHTLNQFLFFQSEVLQSANIKLAIIPISNTSNESSSNEEENIKPNITLPRQLRGLTIVSPKSLRLTGGYSIVTYRRVHGSLDVDNNKNNNSNVAGSACWEIYQVEDLTL